MNEGNDVSETLGVPSVILDGYRGGGLVGEDTPGVPPPGEAGVSD